MMSHHHYEKFLSNVNRYFAHQIFSGCVNYSRDSGVENLWRQPQSFTYDTTTSQQVLRALGPPSQVLAIRKQLAIALIFIVEEIVYLARF